MNVMRYDTPADQLHKVHNLHKHQLHTDKHLFRFFSTRLSRYESHIIRIENIVE